MTTPASGPKPHTALLLHAYPLSGGMWRAQEIALSNAGLQVIVPHLPGFGGASGAISDLRSAARDLLELLPPEPVSVVGLSMGGYLTLELLALAPERFGRVLLADTTAQSDDEEKQKDRESQAARVLQEGRGFIIEAAQKEHSAATFEKVLPLMEAASPEGIAGALRAMAARPDHRETLRGLHKPLLVLVGENDDITPLERAQEMANLGHGDLKIIPGAAHLSNLDQPHAFNQALLEFLA